MKDMFDYLVYEAMAEHPLEVQNVIGHLGLKGRILDVRAVQTSAKVSNDTKNTLMIRNSIQSALPCPLCQGRLEVNKSVSYDHAQDKKFNGSGDVDNVQHAHFYCNNSKDALL